MTDPTMTSDLTQQTALPAASPTQWQREQQRRRALKLMGVLPLVSRQDPPGARAAERLAPPPSVLATRPAPPTREPESAASSGAPSSTPAPRPARPPAPKIDASVDNPTTTRAAVAESSVPATVNRSPGANQDALGEGGNAVSPAVSEAAAAGEAVSFSLLLAAGAGYLWVETLPDRVLASAQLSLATAMARALDGGAAALVYQQFDWPIVANPALPRDLATAQQSLGALMHRMQREQAPNGVIMLGDCAVLPDLAGVACHRIPATRDMLETPQLKAEAWAVLKPLVHRPG